VTGATGADGITGANGEVGVTGATGADGITGANGEVGVTGATGADGAVGVTGATGADGITGANGEVGVTGATGASGLVGATGPTGDIGAPGIITGGPGPTGVTGATGAAATIQIGTVNTGLPGSNAIVTNSGTSSAAVFDMTIPQGADGSGTTVTITETITSPSTLYYLVCSTNAATKALKYTTPSAKQLVFDPSVPKLTIGTGTTLSTGQIHCGNVTAATFTGTASVATKVTLQDTTITADTYYLVCTTNTTPNDLKYSSVDAKKIIFDPSIPKLTIGSGISGSTGQIHCGNVTAATFTGLASSANQVVLTTTGTAAGTFYLVCATNVTPNSLKISTSAAANQLIFDPSTVKLTIGSGIAGTTGQIHCGTVTAATFTGTVSNVNTTAVTTNAVMYILFSPATSGSTTVQLSSVAANALTYNPATFLLQVGTGVGGSGQFNCNTINCTTMTGTAAAANDVVGGAAGQVLCQTGVSATEFTAAGTIGQVLTSQGAGKPTWGDKVATADDIAGGAAGQVLWQSAAGATSFTAAGTAGQVLTSAGTSAPTWGSTIASANNINSGAAGQVLWQSAVGQTSFTAAGTAGQVLTSAGTSAPVWTDAKAFIVVFGGVHTSSTAAYLKYNGDHSSTTSATSTIFSTRFYPPVACKLNSYNRTNNTSPTTASASIQIYKNGTSQNTTAVAVSSQRALVTLGTAISFTTTDYCEVLITSTSQILADTVITLYFV
jgi:hypothetical protein